MTRLLPVTIKRPHTLIAIIGSLLLIGVVAISLLAATEYWTIVPRRDSGVFTYMGARLLHGDIPYRDVWDHKPPLIYLINALGLTFTGSYTGIVIMQALFLYGTLWVGGRLLWRFFSLPATVISLALVTVNFQVIFENGNFTEQYALLFQMLALWWVAESTQYTTATWREIALGAVGAGAFLLRQDLVLLWLVISIYWLAQAIYSQQWRRFATRAAYATIGGLVPLLVVAAFFWLVGAWSALWDAVITYNFSHVATGSTFSLSQLLFSGFDETRIPSWGFSLFTLLVPGWIAALGLRLFGSRHSDAGTSPTIDARHALLTLVLLAAPLGVLFVNLSGYGFTHYYLTWLPVFAVLCAALVHTVEQSIVTGVEKVTNIAKASAENISRALTWMVCVGVVVVCAAWMQTFVIAEFQARLATYDERRTEQTAILTAEYIQRTTDSDDTILLWGAETEVYWMSDRTAPTRFVYQYPLTKEGYTTEAATKELLADLRQQPPTLIIDTRNDALPPFDVTVFHLWEPRRDHAWHDALEPLIEYVNAAYEPIWQINETWYVYRHIEQ